MIFPYSKNIEYNSKKGIVVYRVNLKVFFATQRWDQFRKNEKKSWK